GTERAAVTAGTPATGRAAALALAHVDRAAALAQAHPGGCSARGPGARRRRRGHVAVHGLALPRRVAGARPARLLTLSELERRARGGEHQGVDRRGAAAGGALAVGVALAGLLRLPRDGGGDRRGEIGARLPGGG